MPPSHSPANPPISPSPMTRRRPVRCGRPWRRRPRRASHADEASTYLRRPPFAAAQQPTRLGHLHGRSADRRSVTTSPPTTSRRPGKFPARGLASKWLIAHGERADDLNVYAARRGNWQAMLRGAFTNSTVRNQLSDEIPPGDTVFAPTGEMLPLWVAAERYAELGRSTIIVAGERYGAGSSRDWAAKCPALLGTRAVLALSFERIHRSNLIGMGILPLRLPAQYGPDRLALRSWRSGRSWRRRRTRSRRGARCQSRCTGCPARWNGSRPSPRSRPGSRSRRCGREGIIPMMIERALGGATHTNGHVEEPSP